MALLVTGLLGFATTEAKASHFRYATIDYKPILDDSGNPTGTVEFHIRSGWRRSFFGTPVVGNVISPESFNFGDGQSVSVSLVVTSFSATEDWVLGEFTVQHHYNNAGPFTAMGSSSARLSNIIDGGNQAWRYDIVVSPYSKNNSPSTSLPPVLSLVTGSPNQFFVPVSDLERDSLQFSIAPRANTGVTATNYPPAGLTIDRDTGLISWNTTGVEEGLWFVQIWISDLDDKGNTKSRVPVDFILSNTLTTGGSPPSCLINGSSAAGSFSTSPGTPVSFTVSGVSPNINPVTGNADTPVTLNVSGLPVGASMTPSFTLTAPSPATSTFNWTPTAANGGSFTISYSATDSLGHVALNSVNIFVETNHPPVAKCRDVTVSADAQRCSAAASIDDGSSDPDTGDTIALEQSPPGPYPLGDTTVTLKVTDSHGASDTCTAVVTVRDLTPPDAPVLGDLTAECSATATAPTTTDTCAGNVTGTTTDALTYTMQGTHVITWTFDDGHGNSSTAKQNVIIKDVTPPVIPVLPDVTGECSATATAPTTTDNCTGTVTGTTGDALTYTTQGTHVITWTFDDGHGNSSTAKQNIIIKDVTPPVVPVLPDVTGECSATATAPSTSDNCGTVTGTTGDVLTYTTQGTHVITWTFDDGHGNSSTAKQNVIIKDVTSPVVPMLPDVTGECSATATAPITTDNCAGIVTGTTGDALTYTTQGTHVITWTFDDGHGNSSTAKQNVIIKDVTPPVVPVLPDVTGECSAMATAPTTTDNCAGTVTGTTSDPLTYTTQSTHVITWTFDDGHGNSSTAKQNVIIKDVTPPVIPVLPDVTGECSATATAPTTTDNCAGTVTGTTNDALTFTTQGTHVITWTFDDGHGNSSTAKQNVIIKDVTPPVVPVLPDVTGECSGTTTAPTTTDNCAGTLTGTTTDALTYTTQGTHVITWTFSDGHGNSSVATQKVIVRDSMPPVITDVPANITVQTGPGRATCDQVATWSAPHANDNCTVASLTSDHQSGDTFPKGVTTVTYTATDGAVPAHVVTASFTVTVLDNTPPKITPPPNINTVDNTLGSCAALVDPGTPTASDNCGVKSVVGVRSDNKAVTTPYPVGTTTIVWTATDTSGNTASAQQTVSVTNPAPTVGITGPLIPQPVKTAVNFTATFADNTGDTHTAVWTFDGHSQAATVNEATHAIAATYTFTTVGPHSVSVAVTDDCGQTMTATSSLLVYAYETASGSFVIGDQNAAVGTAVTFWGTQWKVNSMTGGTAPATFKGFADRASTTPPKCGGTWTTDAGAAAVPPQTVPAYLAVFVTNSVNQAGSVFTGSIRQIVVVKTNPGYYAIPGPRLVHAKTEAGTGTVVAVICP